MPRGVADARRAGRQGLDQDPPTGLAPPAAAGELRDQREGALLGAEVRQAQRAVGVEDDAQRDVGEVVALGDHLGADEDAATRRARTRRARSACAAPGGAVGVEAEDLERRQQLVELGLHALGARRHARAIVTEEHSGHASGIGSA